MLAKPDQEIIRQDPSLPGLSLLLDADAFAEEMHPHIHALDSAEAVYVRYKPGENVIVAFRLYVSGKAHLVYAKAHRAEDTAKLAKASSRIEVPSEIGPGRVALPHWATTVSFFPNDSKLKSLHRAGNAQERRRMMAKIVPDRAGLWEAEPELLRYKPERRYVARISDAVLKLHTGPGFAKAEQGRRAIWAKGALQTVPVIGRSRRHRALVYKWIEGRVMADALRDPASDLRFVAPVGAALATLHRRRPMALSVLMHQHISEALFAAAVAVGATSPSLAARAKGLASRISALIELPKRLALIHGDFYAKQILLSGETPTMLDFDRLGLGDPSVDIGTFLAHLERDRIRYNLSLDRIEAVRAELLEGYAAIRNPPQDDRLALHTAAAILQLSPHPFRFREPEWPARTAALLDGVEAQLDEAQYRTSSRNVSVQRPVRVSDPYDAASDEALPMLGRALDPDIAARSLEAFSTQLAGKDGTLRLQQIRVVRHRPGRRALVHYTLRAEGRDAQGGMVSLFGKVRARGLDRVTFSLNSALWRDGFGVLSRDGVVVPEPVGIWPEARMWLQRQASGEIATEALRGSDGVQVAGRIAHALAKLHREGPVPDRRHMLADELALLHDRVPRVGETHPHLALRVDRVLEACDEIASKLTKTRLRPLHRDFYPGNVLVSDRHITLLDLDLYALGDPALDAGNFIAHLIEQGLRERGEAAAFMGPIRAFEDTFTRLEGADIRTAIWAYTTFTLVRHLYISTRIESRRTSTEAILILCEQRLESPTAAHHFIEV